MAPDPLAERLARLAEAELPEATQEALSRALDRAERDRCIYAAARLAGGCTALLEVLDNHGWRLPVWRSRGRCPEVANPVLAALFEAGDLPCARQIQRILRHPVSGATD